MSFAGVLLFLSTFFSSAFAQTACNGHAQLCNRKYSNVSQIGSHDSPFVGPLPQDNQDIVITAQLNAGVRFLQAQTHKDLRDSSTLDLCHTSCLLLDVGPLQSYLGTVKTWLDANTHEVLTLLLVNGDGVDISLFDKAFTNSGIKHYAYVPPSSPSTLAIDAWPTLQQLITAGTRLVVFLGMFPQRGTPCVLPNVTSPQLTAIRHRRKPHQSPVHPRRILLFLRNSLRHHRPQIPRVHARPARRWKPERQDVHRQSLPRCRLLRHQGS